MKLCRLAMFVFNTRTMLEIASSFLLPLQMCTSDQKVLFLEGLPHCPSSEPLCSLRSFSTDVSFSYCFAIDDKPTALLRSNCEICSCRNTLSSKMSLHMWTFFPVLKLTSVHAHFLFFGRWAHLQAFLVPPLPCGWTIYIMGPLKKKDRGRRKVGNPSLLPDHIQVSLRPEKAKMRRWFSYERFYSSLNWVRLVST